MTSGPLEPWPRPAGATIGAIVVLVVEDVVVDVDVVVALRGTD
jgi:hypothetical protein